MVGKTVSHYKIESELGQGGMGIVYRATDTVLERTVALKFLPPMFSRDEDAQKRFVHEARAVSALDHPNVAVVHEIGNTDTGQAFIVMAYYNGQTLEDIIAEGPISFDDAVAYALSIARGLGAAHDKGIIHRDIKPGNVMVTESGLLKILDFGLAKVQDVTMTMGAKSLGTLAYMSPEQAQGTAVDARTDLWALGVVFYEMLCGKRPFDGPYDAAILYAAAHEAHESVANRREGTPDHVAAIVDKLLQKKPDLRYQSAQEVVDDLVALTGPTPSVISSVIQPVVEPVQAPVPAPAVSAILEPVASAVQPKSKNPLILVIGVVLVAVLGLLGWQALSGPSVEPVAVQSNRELAQEYLNKALAELEKNNFSLALVELERGKAADSTYVPLWSSLAGVYFQLNQYPNAIRAARKAISLDSTAAGPYYNLGLSLAEQGDIEGAISALRTAIERNNGFIQAYSALSDILIESGEPEKALGILEIAAMKVSPGAQFEFIIYKNQGKALMSLGRYSEAVNYLESSSKLNDTWPETFYLLAKAYDELGDRMLAKPMWERYLELEKSDPVKRGEARQRLGL